MTKSLGDRLRKAGIHHYDVLIHDQKKDWLIKNFKAEGAAPKYPVNVARLMRNLVWQMKERIATDEKEFHELIRTYWYMYVKSTLARADSLSKDTDQYKKLTENIADMVRVFKLMTYKDIGFRDENEANMKVGVNANFIPFSEKLGHFGYLTELQRQHNVSVIALGGQPSVMNVEYFVDDIKKAKSAPQLVDRPKIFSLGIAGGNTKFNIRRSFYLYSIVDYDPSGWISRDAFIKNLNHYKIKNTKVHDLINPDVLKPEEIMLARYPIRAGADMEAKNKKWLADVEARHYKNQKYLVETLPSGKKKLYGLEAEAISTARLNKTLEDIMVPIIGGNEVALKVHEMTILNQAIKDLIFFKLTHPEDPVIPAIR